MVLGLTYGDLLIIAGGGFLLLGKGYKREADVAVCFFPEWPLTSHMFASGPKELPAFARLAGKAAGRAVALVNEFRSKLMTVANDAEVTKVRFHP